jgi:hypothetical protein
VPRNSGQFGACISGRKWIQLFDLLAANIAGRVPDPEKRRVFGRTLYGVGESMALEEWVVNNIDGMASSETEEELLGLIWSCAVKHIQNDNFRKWRPLESLAVLARGWIKGESFGSLHDAMIAAGAKIGLKSRTRSPKVEHIVEMGESALGFDAAHVLGAIVDICGLVRPGDEEAPVPLLHKLQKRLKYGLPSESAVVLYEAGFSDRVLSIELASVIGDATNRSAMTLSLRRLRAEVVSALRRYPRYYSRVLDGILS